MAPTRIGGNSPVAGPKVQPPETPERRGATTNRSWVGPAAPKPADTFTPPRTTRFPGADWEVVSPQVVGFDPVKLEQLGAYARRIGSDAVVVVRGGRVVYEWYADGVGPKEPLGTWSVAKTFTAALVGAAIHRGHIQSVDQRASDFIREWAGPNDPRRDIRIRDLLTGVSGLDTDAYPEETGRLRHLLNLAADYAWAVPPGSWFHPNQEKHALSARATHRPGEKWKYNNRAIQALETILERATGKPVEELARQALWEPIGMAPTTRWEKDAAGNPKAYSSVKASPKDLARFGHLLLNDGVWNGRRLIDADFARQMRQPSPLNPAYGFLTWLNTDAPAWRGLDNRRFEGKPFPSMPSEYFSAQGLGNNFIGVDPRSETVIVHARRAPHERFFRDWPWNLARELFGDSNQKHHRRFLELLKAAER